MEWPSRPPPPPPRAHGYGHEHEPYHPMILPPRRDFQNPVEPAPYSGMQSYAPERHNEPLPFGTARRRTESRRVEEPGRSRQKISHRHGSGHQKQSAFTSVQNETTPGHYYADDSPKKFHYHYPNETPYRFSRRYSSLDGQEKIGDFSCRKVRISTKGLFKKVARLLIMTQGLCGAQFILIQIL